MQTPEEPKPIATEIEQVLSRLRDKTLRSSESPKPSGPSNAEILAKLESRGYPKRHRLRLADMHGPSLEKARELLPKVMSGDCLILLVGDRGPGKTQMVAWWAANLAKAGLPPGYYRKTTDLIAEIKATWSDPAAREADVLRKYRTARLLVLDEFHERGGSDWESRILVNMLDHRYDDMLATVLIANMSREKVRSEINPSVLSRAEETGGLVVCDWESYRTGKK